MIGKGYQINFMEYFKAGIIQTLWQNTVVLFAWKYSTILFVFPYLVKILFHVVIQKVGQASFIACPIKQKSEDTAGPSSDSTLK